VEAIKKDNTNSHFKSKYFDINGLLEEVLPKLNKHGLILVQRLAANDTGMLLITEVCDAESGESISSTMKLPEVGKPQEYGSAITYFRRYSLQALLGLMAEDDDGNVASGRSAPPPSSGGSKFGAGKFGGKA
jgi:hypothetical protein